MCVIQDKGEAPLPNIQKNRLNKFNSNKDSYG